MFDQIDIEVRDTGSAIRTLTPYARFVRKLQTRGLKPFTQESVQRHEREEIACRRPRLDFAGEIIGSIFLALLGLITFALIVEGGPMLGRIVFGVMTVGFGILFFRLLGLERPLAWKTFPYDELVARVPDAVAGPFIKNDNEWVRERTPPECQLVIRVLMEGERVLDPLLGIESPEGEIAWVNVWGSATDWRDVIRHEPPIASS